MKKILLLGGLLYASTAAANTLTAESVEAFFDSAFDVQKQDVKIAGAVVAVVKDGDVLFKRGYGWADIEARVPADPDKSLFRIASITKTFVWTGVMQLVEQGKLDLDVPVIEYIDFGFDNPFEEPVRLHHLLTHTPGFEESAIGRYARTASGVQPLSAYLPNHAPRLVRPPGHQASYSNYGSAVAGYVIERVTHKPWADYLDATILTPLQMSSTNLHTNMAPELVARHAKSYVFRNGRFIPQPYFYLQEAPAGIASTTADDMTRYMIAHLNDGVWQDRRILSQQASRQMRTPLFTPHPDIPPMLRGFYRSDRNNQVIYGHGGDTNQFHSDLRLIPREKLGIFVSFNSDPAASARTQLVNAFIDHFFPTDYLRAPPDQPATAIDLAQYEGDYLPLRRNVSTFERLGVLTGGVTMSAEQDTLRITGSRATQYSLIAADRFTNRYQDVPLVFVRDNADRITHAVIGSPLATYERVAWFDAPRILQLLFAVVAFGSLAAAVGWGYRGFRRAPGVAALPRLHVAVGWLHAILLLFLLAQLAQALTGNLDEFAFGVPDAIHINLLLMNLNLALGLFVIAFATLQWIAGRGSLGAKLRYSLFALIAALNVYLGWHFNYATYLLNY